MKRTVWVKKTCSSKPSVTRQLSCDSSGSSVHQSHSSANSWQGGLWILSWYLHTRKKAFKTEKRNCQCDSEGNEPRGAERNATWGRKFCLLFTNSYGMNSLLGGRRKHQRRMQSRIPPVTRSIWQEEMSPRPGQTSPTQIVPLWKKRACWSLLKSVFQP